MKKCEQVLEWVCRKRQAPHLFNVVDLPDEGLPTRPISGSRGILYTDRHEEFEIVHTCTLSSPDQERNERISIAGNRSVTVVVDRRCPHRFSKGHTFQMTCHSIIFNNRLTSGIRLDHYKFPVECIDS